MAFSTYWQMRDHSGAYTLVVLQVRLCRERVSGNIYAMKKLKKSEMLSRGQVRDRTLLVQAFVGGLILF